MRKLLLSKLNLKEEIIGPDLMIDGVNLVNRTSIYKSTLSYITSSKYLNFLEKNPNIKALIVPYSVKYDLSFKSLKGITFISSNDPELLFYNIHEYLVNQTDFYNSYEFTTKKGKNFLYEKSSYISPNGVLIGNNVYIGHNSVIFEGSIIGDNTYIGNNSIIGSKGFQVIRFGDKLVSIKHVGGVNISNNVRISDTCTIANSLFEGFNEIGENSKLDNLVHVAHNCIIGKNVCLTAGVIISGSVTINDNSWVGPNSSILNKVTIGNNSIIGISSNVVRDVPNNSISFGNPSKNIPKE